MKPDQLEDSRYQQADYCQIRAEENVLLSHLKYFLGNKSQTPSLLDLGCGSGLITKNISDMGFKVKGIDFSPVAVQKAKNNGIEAVVANLDEGIAEPDASWDIVLASDIIEHIFDPISVIKEAARVIKPNGHLLITIPNDVSIMVRLKTLLGISHQEIMYKRSGFYKHHTFFTKRLLEFMLTLADLSIIKQNRVTNLGHKKQLTNPSLPLLFTNTLVVVAQKKSDNHL